MARASEKSRWIRASSVLAVVLGRHLLGDAHPPGIQDELAHLGLVERREPALDPVVPQVARARHQELVRLGADQGLALLLGNPKPISVSSREKATKTIRPTRNL